MKDGRHWPLIIVGILVGNFVAVGTLIYFSGSDPSHVVEDNYYERAVTHDATRAQQRENARLGWNAAVAMVLPSGAGEAEVAVRLVDSEGNAITGAALEFTTYHRARAGTRLTLGLREASPGNYTAPLDSRRRGLWHVSLIARRGALTFTHETTAELGARDANVEGERR